MRRPVKPFVTEYKGVVRRQSGFSFKVEDEPDAQPTWPSPEPRTGIQSQPEDGYEAALRAADALFSGASVSSRDGPSAVDDGEDAASAGMPGGGRILQAIVDTPPVAPDAPDDGPKRRGRRPGSKNKPKIVDPAAAPVHMARRPLGEARTPILAAITASDAPVSSDRPDPSLRSGTPLPALTIARPPPRGATAKAAGAKTEQFPWVRTKLKPGENWKRRLPKVIW